MAAILTEQQQSRMEAALHAGAGNATEALTKWLNRPAKMILESTEHLTLVEAAELLDREDPMCVGSMQMPDHLPGQMLIAFDSETGLAAVDMILGRKIGSAKGWEELEQSAALETTNIVCCAFLNAVVQQLNHESLSGLIPHPPVFHVDFAETLLQSAIISQATDSDQIILMRTLFDLSQDDTPMDWTLLWIPELEALNRLSAVL